MTLAGSQMGNRLRFVGSMNIFALAAWVIVAMMSSTGPSHAAEVSATQAVVAVRISGTAQKSEIEIDFEGNSEAAPNILAMPHRLVVDMPETLFAFGDVKVPKNGYLKSMRQGLVQSGRSRMVFSYAGPFALDTFSIAPSKQPNLQTLKMCCVKIRPSRI